MSATKRCTFCGEPVSDRAYDFIGSQRIWLCDSAECDREARDAHRAAMEEAQWDAKADGYSRYM